MLHRRFVSRIFGQIIADFHARLAIHRRKLDNNVQRLALFSVGDLFEVVAKVRPNAKGR